MPVIIHTELVFRDRLDETKLKQLLLGAAMEFALNTNSELFVTEMGDELINRTTLAD